ncbi:MAG: magnesium transporter CorA family protein [Patescibacteria group bacterium]|jgi:magnesium transporter
MPITTLLLDAKKVIPGHFADLKTGKPVWVDTNAPTAEELSEVSKVVGMNTEEITALLKPTQRPTLFNVKNYSVVVFGMTKASEAAVHVVPVLFFISHDRNDLITIHAEFCRAVERVRAYTEDHRFATFSKGITNVLYALLDEIIDGYFGQVDELGTRVDTIEKHMFEYRQSNTVMRNTFNVKKSLLYMHKALIGNREVVHAIEKQYGQFLDNERLENFRELNGSIIQLIEMITTYHDIVTTSVEIHLSAISNNLNVTMKRVTSWGALILVPSLIAGIFGMNFQNEPLLHNRFGFFISLAVMIVSVYVLAWYFKKRDWL